MAAYMIAARCRRGANRHGSLNRLHVCERTHPIVGRQERRRDMFTVTDHSQAVMQEAHLKRTAPGPEFMNGSGFGIYEQFLFHKIQTAPGREIANGSTRRVLPVSNKLAAE